MRKTFLFFVSLFSILSLVAQQKSTVSGSVKDKITGEALPLANVIFTPTIAVSTDFDGNYSLDVPYGEYTVKVSYVGFSPTEKLVVVDKPTLRQNFTLSGIILDQAEIIADVATERKTPVAFTNVLPAQIKEELGSQQVPMILNSTPGVYATPAGSGDGTARVSIRGFKQRNVAVLFDGIPVNDMETGNVFWSNWFGADQVMRTTQVQRGLGASKLTVPAIGGTINIITKNINSKKSFSLKQEIGSQNMLRTSLGYNSGRLKNGFGVTLALSYMDKEGWYDQTYTTSYFYFVKLEKQLNKHLISFTAFGAPTDQGNSGNRNPIATYSKDYARSLFTGSDSEYNNLSTYNQAFNNWQNNPSSVDEYNSVATQTGFGNADGTANHDAFLQAQSSSDFIDTTMVQEGGLTYNNHWGKLQRTGESEAKILNERQRQYHKPLISLKHLWAVNDRVSVNNIAYYSQGVGGATSRAPSLGFGDYTEDIQVNFQRDYNSNTIGNLFGPPIDTRYDPELLKSGVVLQKSFNNHYWLGLLSSVDVKLNENLRFNGGLDLRTYEGNSFREVFDLLGGDYYIGPNDEINQNDPTLLDNMKREGDVISFNSNSFVRWAGLYTLLEYSKEQWTGFLNVTGVNNSYRRTDDFLEREENGEINSTDWKSILGFTVKTGANYNINEWSSIFVNTGFLSRTPQFRNVIDFRNQFFRDLENEKISSVELGYNIAKKKWAISLNSYYTVWQNRPFSGGVFVLIDDQPVRANINAMDARHAGIELGGKYKAMKELEFDYAVSFGDWRWTSQDSVNFFDDNRNLLLDEGGNVYFRSFDARGVLVGDAPQTQISVAARYAPIERLYIKPRLTFFDKYYSDFDPLGLSGEKAGKQSWKIPAYSLLDIHLGYTFKFEKCALRLNGSIFNALDKIYIADAQNNAGAALLTLQDGTNPRATVVFDANSAGVIMGYGRRFNLSAEITF